MHRIIIQENETGFSVYITFMMKMRMRDSHEGSDLFDYTANFFTKKSRHSKSVLNNSSIVRISFSQRRL